MWKFQVSKIPVTKVFKIDTKKNATRKKLIPEKKYQEKL